MDAARGMANPGEGEGGGEVGPRFASDLLFMITEVGMRVVELSSSTMFLMPTV